MIRKAVVVVVAVGGLILAPAGLAFAGSGSHHGHHESPNAVCNVTGDAVVGNNVCNTTNVFDVDILGSVLDLFGGGNGGGN